MDENGLEQFNSSSYLAAQASAPLAVWAGQDGSDGPWDETWGKVGLLVGDCFYEQLKSLPIWRALNFWYLRSAMAAVRHL